MDNSQIDQQKPGQVSAFAAATLRGVGQIMLQENALTGFLFLAGIFFGGVSMGIAAVIATVSGTLTAKSLGYDQDEIEQGHYGFSAALVGVALLLFLKPVAIVWLFVGIGSAAATALQHFFIRRQIPVFTLPFVLVTWAILLVAHFVYPSVLNEPANSPTGFDLAFALRGYGQVIFQGSAVAGVIFFAAVSINSPVAALYGLFAAVFAGLISMAAGAPPDDVALGLFSYNAVLCAIAFAGKKLMDGIWVFIAVIFSIAISLAMAHYQFVQLTFPFVAASVISLVLRHLIQTKYDYAE